MSDGKWFARFVLVVINLIFFMSGVLMFAFGIIGLTNPSLLFNIVAIIPGVRNIPESFNLGDIIQGSGIFMIVLGGVVGCIGMFGCVGACCEHKCFLKMYTAILFVVLAAQVALIIFAAVFPDQFQGPIKNLMKTSLVNRFKNEITQTSSGDLAMPTTEVEVAWTTLQLQTRCCGAYGPQDYNDTRQWSRRYNFSSPVESITNAVVPLSCCSHAADVDFSRKNTFRLDIFDNWRQCFKGNTTYINQHNCFRTVWNLIGQYSLIAIGIAAGICGVEVILIVLAICMCKCITHEEKKN